jgi:hypothetical protein
MQEPTHLNFQHVDYNHHVGAVPSFTPYLPQRRGSALSGWVESAPRSGLGAVLKRCALVCALHADNMHGLETNANQGVGEDFN